MYNSELENSLLLPDIADRLTDYVAVQEDINDTLIKAACLIAQKLDIIKIIKKENWDRCFEENVGYEEDLFELVVPALCYFTYARCLRMFQGNLTDSGYSIEEATESIASTKATSHEFKSVGSEFLADVIEFLDNENPDNDVAEEHIVKRVRTFGGKENRASN